MPPRPAETQQPTKRRILIAGTGGQGVITAARLLADFFVQHGQQVVSSQLHGMAQRGGAVQSAVMVNCGIGPALPAGGADLVLGLEPVETARALPFISAQTTVFMNSVPVVPYILSQRYVLGEGAARYPSLEELRSHIRAATSRLLTLDATALAKQAGSIKTLNLVMLGCLFGSGLLGAAAEDFRDALPGLVPTKLVEINRAAFLSGVAAIQDLSVHEDAP